MQIASSLRFAMPAVHIYTKNSCPYCTAAKALLARKKIGFTEISVEGDPLAQKQMSQRAAGCSTVPQIFVGETHIGGCDELYALEGAGKLDPLLTPVRGSAGQ
jgi:glutaredoxin 3